MFIFVLSYVLLDYLSSATGSLLVLFVPVILINTTAFSFFYFPLKKKFIWKTTLSEIQGLLKAIKNTSQLSKAGGNNLFEIITLLKNTQKINNTTSCMVWLRSYGFGCSNYLGTCQLTTPDQGLDNKRHQQAWITRLISSM